jgi:hypothetical protein
MQVTHSVCKTNLTEKTFNVYWCNKCNIIFEEKDAIYDSQLHSDINNQIREKNETINCDPSQLFEAYFGNIKHESNCDCCIVNKAYEFWVQKEYSYEHREWQSKMYAFCGTCFNKRQNNNIIKKNIEKTTDYSINYISHHTGFKLKNDFGSDGIDKDNIVLLLNGINIIKQFATAH